VIDSLREIWSRARKATLYFPLGVGGHVDHELVHRAGRALLREGADARFYEDFPYAVSAAVGARVERDWTSEEVDVTAAFSERMAAVRAYASQLATAFEGLGDPEEVTSTYAASATRSDVLVERFWRPGE
jgi:LmbE family N-acetylglucosaminyl deacetylase